MQATQLVVQVRNVEPYYLTSSFLIACTEGDYDRAEQDVSNDAQRVENVRGTPPDHTSPPISLSQQPSPS